MLFNLIEKTAGPWNGKVWRSEEMTQEEADRRNAEMQVIQWELAKAEPVAEKPRRKKQDKEWRHKWKEVENPE